MNKLMSAFGALALAVSFVLPANAAIRNTNPVEGKIKNIYTDMFTISVVPEAEKSSEINTSGGGEIAFRIDSSTGYENFNTLTELKEGDVVEVTYQDNNKSRDRIATLITKSDSSTTTERTTTTTTTTTSDDI